MWGRGNGLPWGGGPVVPVSQPVSEIASNDPITFDFTDGEIDGPLPGGWTFFSHQTLGAALTGEAEPDPNAHFSIRDNLGWWHYRRNPAVGEPFDQRGFVASPNNVLVGKNGRISAVLRTPPSLLDARAFSALFWECEVALRGNDDLTDCVSARARAVWESGLGWTTPVVVEAVRRAGQPPVVLGSAIPDLPDPFDIWGASGTGLIELSAEVRDSVMTVALGGVTVLQATVPYREGKPGLFVRVEAVQGNARLSLPAVAGLQLQSLRDLNALGPSAELPGSVQMEAPQKPTVSLPLRGLLERKALRRQGARQFIVLEDLDVEVQESRIGIRTGDVIRAVEPYVGQELTQTVFDLAAMRGQRGGR